MVLECHVFNNGESQVPFLILCSETNDALKEISPALLPCQERWCEVLGHPRQTA